MRLLALILTIPLSLSAIAQERAKPAGGGLAIPSSNTPGVKIKPAITPMNRGFNQLEGSAAAQQTRAREGAKSLEAAMKGEIANFDKIMADKFSVALLHTGDPQTRQFIASGVLKMNPDIYTRMESGLASIYIENGKMNGQSRRVCYVLSNSQRASHLWRSFVPENDHSQTGIAWAAKYLVAHEVGHCLDRWQRLTYTKNGDLTQTHLATLGIPPIAFERAFGVGRTIKASEFQAQQVVLNRDGALMQYQERVADAFAVLWMMGQKAPNENLKPIWDTRNRVAGNGAHHAHSTTPALEKAYAFGMKLKSMPDLQSLWDMARQSQIAAGVDQSLGKNSTLVHSDAEAREAAPGAKPGAISQKGVLPATIRFDRLPKFGQKR